MPRGGLPGAAVNRSRSVLRRQAITGGGSPGALPDPPAAEGGVPGLLERSAVWAALRGLPGRQREVIVLRYYAGLPEDQIAAAMGITRAR